MAKPIIARKNIDLFAVCGSYADELFAGMQKSFEKNIRCNLFKFF